MRNETEWTELVNYNYNILVGADRDSIVNAYISHSFLMILTVSFMAVVRLVV